VTPGAFAATTENVAVRFSATETFVGFVTIDKLGAITPITPPVKLDGDEFAGAGPAAGAQVTAAWSPPPPSFHSTSK